MIEGQTAQRGKEKFPDPAIDGRMCELCGGRTFSMLHSWEADNRWNPAGTPIAVWKCACGFTFLHPVPSIDQLPDEGDWWSGKRKRFSRKRRLKAAWNQLRRKLFGGPKERFLWYMRKVVPSGRFLDAGFGKGEMLLLASRFYDSVGIDPSPSAVAWGKGKGLNVVQGTLENYQCEPNSFDSILLDSVIEHVEHPGALLQRAHQLLRDGGVVIIVTPKLNGPAHRLHGADWNGFRHGYHTFLFTGKTLGELMRKSGFQVLRWPRRNRILDDILVLWGRKTT